MKATRLIGALALVVLVSAVFVPAASAQYSAGVDMAIVSKYIWRGQRLTDEASFQPSLTIGVGGFAFNAWGTMDLTDINPGTVTPDLQGRFSEIDYTFSYDHSFEDVSVGAGVIFYTFPDRFNTTEEIYGTVSFDSVPLAPNATLYVDVDETSAGAGSTGVYFLLGAGHSIETGGDVVPSVDLSASIAFASGGFTDFYYGLPSSGGAHDASFGVSVPIEIDDNWSASAFLNYSGLLTDSIRSAQYTNPTPGIGTEGADTVWGGFSVSLGF